MFEQTAERSSRSSLNAWLVRGAIGAAFAIFGAWKFTDPEWVRLSGQIGFGQWFRVFTGAVEILGGILVVIPWTATAGLALLVCTMGSATLIWAFVLGQPSNYIVTGASCAGLVLFRLNRRGS